MLGRVIGPGDGHFKFERDGIDGSGTSFQYHPSFNIEYHFNTSADHHTFASRDTAHPRPGSLMYDGKHIQLTIQVS